MKGRQRKIWFVLVGLWLTTSAFAAPNAVSSQPNRPNILWIIADDLGVQLGCYGDTTVRTPNIDRLASEGVRFTQAFTTAPVCSPSRSALITGMYQTSIGAHHHRSHRLDSYALPAEVKPITEYLRAAGYFTANVKNIGGGYKVAGKTDFNFTAPNIFDGEDWKQRKSGQPFYAQVNIFEPHRGAAPNVWAHVQGVEPKVDPANVKLPPYLPDHPIVRADWANYLNAIQLLDQKVGAVLDRLRQEGLLDNTVIFFFGDNGQCQIRGKQWLYESGLHIPLLVRWPQKIKAGTVNHDLISAIDISAASLQLAGIARPWHLQGQSFLQSDGSLSGSQREYVFGARDRCGEAFDRIRSVRDRRYKYIRNYHPEISYTQPSNYIDTSYPAISVMRELFAAGKLNSVQSLFMQPRKPAEELYDLSRDPYEINNLAASAKHQAILKKLRLTLDHWVAETKDQGALPELESARKEN